MKNEIELKIVETKTLIRPTNSLDSISKIGLLSTNRKYFPKQFLKKKNSATSK